MTFPLRPLALAFYFALLVLTLLWEGWLAPARHPVFWLVLKTVPLLLLLPGLWRDRPKSYLSAGLLMLPYFVEGVVLAWTLRAQPLAWDGALGLAWLETALTLGVFTCATLHARRRFGDVQGNTNPALRGMRD